MKILHFFPWTTWGTLGGTEKYIIEIAIQQSQTNEIFIAYPLRRQKGLKIVPQKHYTEIQLSDPNPKNNSLIGVGIIPPVFSIREWAKIVKKKKFDVVHFHCYESYLLPYIIMARFYNAKVVFTPHIVNFTCANGNLINTINNQICDGKIINNRCTKCLLTISANKSLYKYFTKSLFVFIKKVNLLCLKPFITKIITVNDHYAHVLQNNGFDKNKMTTIKPLIQKKNAFEIKNNPQTTTKNLKVIYIGRLTSSKGLDVLLKSFESLANSAISLHIYGPPGDVAAEQLASEYFQYHGTFAFDEINSILRKYDVLCLPSTSYEMMPLTIQEAVNNGLYVIGSDAPGIRELIEQEGIHGRIFHRKSVTELCDALLEIQKNKIRNDHVSFESFTIIAKKIIEVYQILVNKTKL